MKKIILTRSDRRPLLEKYSRMEGGPFPVSRSTVRSNRESPDVPK